MKVWLEGHLRGLLLAIPQAQISLARFPSYFGGIGWKENVWKRRSWPWSSTWGVSQMVEAALLSVVRLMPRSDLGSWEVENKTKINRFESQELWLIPYPLFWAVLLESLSSPAFPSSPSHYHISWQLYHSQKAGMNQLLQPVSCTP